MHRRVASSLLLASLTVLFLGLLAIPAGAEITDGPCRGSATFDDGRVLDAARPRNDVFEGPPGATVAYSGDLGPGAQKSDEPVPFNGGVSLRIPRMSVPIASWEGETVEVSDAGAYTYSLPDVVPRGTGGLQLSASHNHAGLICAAVVTVAVEGSPGVVAAVAGGLTAVAGAGTVAAGRKKP